MGQSVQEIKQLIQKMDLKLREEYKYIHVLDARLPFQVSIAEVIRTDGIYYSRSDWATNLIMITTNGIYIPFSIVLATLPWADSDEQPYSKFLQGIVDIITVMMYNEDIEEVLKLANTIIKKGEIACYRLTSGPWAGKLQFSFCKYGYKWF